MRAACSTGRYREGTPMMRLITGFAVVGSILTFLPIPVSPAASNTATTPTPLDGPNQLETHIFLNCLTGKYPRVSG
jgi:hypothetical protein